jgi:nitroreductase
MGDAVGDVVLETMATARSMRWFTGEPVDPELIDRLVWAGTRASSPNNTQHWDFVVVTAPEVKRQVHDAIRSALRPAGERTGPPPSPADPSERLTFLGSMNLMERLSDVPALILVCGANRYPEGEPILEYAYSAVYAAAQNMIVAARALGLGAAFTTFHQRAQPEIKKILGIPADHFIGVTMPVGWPARPFGPVRRRPVSEVLHRDGW